MNQLKVQRSKSSGDRFKTVQSMGQSLLLLLACLTTQVSAQEAGKLTEIEIPNADIRIRFRYCPKTTEPLVTGDPSKEDQPRFATNGFYLSEMEIRQAEYEAVMGQEKLKHLQGRIKRVENFSAAGDEYSRGEDFPIYLLTMVEAVAFCDKLEKMVQAAEGGVIKSTFRIPSQYEWQYACRGRVGPEAAKFPHFSGWPATIPEMQIPQSWDGGDVSLKKFCENKIREKKLEIDGVEIVSEGKEVRGFTGSQEQVLAICNSVPDDNDNIHYDEQIIGEFLKQGIGLEYDIVRDGEINIEVREVSGGAANNWSFRHMNTNVFEWSVFSESADSAEIKLSWEAVKNEDIGVEGAILGGGYMTDDWEKYTVYFQRKIGNTELFPNDEDVDSNGAGNMAGIRLLFESGLAQDWLVMIRKAAITNPIPELDHEQLSRHRRNVPRLLPDDGEAAVARGRIDYYRALAYMRAKDTDNAMKAFKQAEPVIGKNDDYFKFLSVVLSEDGK